MLGSQDMQNHVVLGLLAMSFATACATSAPKLALNRAANEFQCSKSSITVKELIPYTEAVDACGHHVVYTCPSDGVHRVCIREGSSATTSQ
jgi:hypothetical protein